MINCKNYNLDSLQTVVLSFIQITEIRGNLIALENEDQNLKTQVEEVRIEEIIKHCCSVAEETLIFLFVF